MSSFHGCMRKNKDGSNRIIEKNKWCLAYNYPVLEKSRKNSF